MYVEKLNLNITYNREAKELKIQDIVYSPVDVFEIGEAIQEHINNEIIGR